MKPPFLFCLFIVIVTFNVVSTKLSVRINVTQTNKTNADRTSSYITITPDIRTISLEITTGLSFFIIQAHSMKSPLFLFNNENDTLLSEPRTSTGLFQHIYENNPNYIFYLESANSTSAILYVQGYDASAPIPGGCNLVNEPEEIPYQSLHVTEDMISVVVQAPSQIGKTCEESKVKLEMFVYFFDGDYNKECEYYNHVGKLLTVEGILKNAIKVSEVKTNTRLVTFYNNYNGKGMISAIIANSGNSSSAYVSATTFGGEENSDYHYYLGSFLLIFGTITSFNGETFLLITNISSLAWFLVYIMGSQLRTNFWYLAVPAVPITFIISGAARILNAHKLVNPLILAYYITNMLFYFSSLSDSIFFKNYIYYALIRLVIVAFHFCVFACSKYLTHFVSVFFYTSNGLSMLTFGMLYYHFWFDYRRISNTNYQYATIVIPEENIDIVNVVVALLIYVIATTCKYFGKSNKFPRILRNGMMGEHTPLLYQL